MTRPVHYDNTILIRLSSEMKEAFYAVCKALVALHQANTLES